MKAETAIPSRHLLLKVRAAMVIKGTSFNAWCKEHGVVRRTAEQSLTGQNRSENALELARWIISEAGLAEELP